MTSLNLALRKALWLGLSAFSALMFFKFAEYHPIAYKGYALNPHALYHTESWMHAWFILTIVSLIMMLREK